MKKSISKIKWVATINEYDQSENNVIRIGIQKFKDNYSEKTFFDLVSENGNDIYTGGVKTYEKAFEAIYMIYGHWATFQWIDY